MAITFKLVPSLEKVFCDREPEGFAGVPRISGFANETLSFQAAFTAQDEYASQRVFVQADCALPLRVSRVESVPVRFACHQDADADYLRREPGLYPDLLVRRPVMRLYAGQWQSAFICLEGDGGHAPGAYTAVIRLLAEDGTERARAEIAITVHPQCLPEQALIRTDWLHADWIAEYYRVPVFSDAHFALWEKHIACAARHGVNMVLTPIHTPPLDTRVGGERATVQLVDIQEKDGQYTFGFQNLRRFVRMAQNAGIRYFEMAHLYTQWGARHAPKIVAGTGDAQRRIFGWETDALSAEYRDFLAQYLRALTAELRALGIAEHTYFHISDEPSEANLQSYLSARNQAAPYLAGFKIIDAMSDIALYDAGACAIPVPANTAMEHFLARDIQERWTYYCVSQYKEVSNAFLSMPAARTRMLGVQLYKNDVKGFLHWAFNFYGSQQSDYMVDPHLNPDADGFAPAGDAFLVYPGADGEPEESLRLHYMLMAMQDLRALRLLESLIGREETLKMLPEGLTMREYPRERDFLPALRERVDARILAAQA